MTKLGPLPREASRFAFEYVDGMVTQDDFPALIERIRESVESELGPRAYAPAASPGEASRYRE